MNRILFVVPVFLLAFGPNSKPVFAGKPAI